MSTKQSSKQLALKGKKAAFDMVRVMDKLEVATKHIFFKLFDSQIQPSLLYASEVWGLLVWMFHFERLTILYTMNWEDFSSSKLLYSGNTILV